MKPLKVAFVVLVVSCLYQCGTPYGVWHPVKRGDTLYRISRTYNVPIERIMKHNPQITDPTLIIAGDKLFIPGASEVKKTVPPEQPPSGVASSGYKGQRSKASDGGKSHSIPSENVPAERSKDFWDSKDLEFVWPARGQVTSRFAERRGGRTHRGIDIAAPEGAPIKATESGQVIYSGKISGYGKVIVIEHPSKFVSVYAHNRKNYVKAGEWVKKGDKIAEVGKTGRASGPHLHFDIRVNNTPVDPLKYLSGGGG